MELKQWLYQNGEEFPWNTGNWMKCKEQATAENAGDGTHDATVQERITFQSKSIQIFGRVQATPYLTRSGLYHRSGGTVHAHIGTITPLFTSIQHYKSLKIIGANSTSVNYGIRVGAANNIDTTIFTATVLQSGSTETINLGDYNPFFVIGRTLSFPRVSAVTYDPGDLNVSFTSEITEIYLV